MSKALITEAYLTDIADAIRAKNGSSDTYTPEQMAAAIAAIPTGGDVDVEALSVTQNGTYTAPTGKAYSPVTVNVSGGSSILLADNKYQTSGSFTYDKTISIQEAGTYTIGVQAYTSNLTVKINDVAQTLTVEVSADFTRLYSATVSLSAGDVIDIYATSSGKSTVTAFIIKE